MPKKRDVAKIALMRARKLQREKKRKAKGAAIIVNKSGQATASGPFGNVVPPPRIPSGFESDIFVEFL